MIRKYNPEKITSYQITKDYAHIDNQCLESMVLYKFKRNSAIIESICHAVGKPHTMNKGTARRSGI